MNKETRELLERCLARAKLSIHPLDAILCKDIEAALAAPVQEPICYLTHWYIEPTMHSEADEGFEECQAGDLDAFPVYTSPPEQSIVQTDYSNKKNDTR